MGVIGDCEMNTVFVPECICPCDNEWKNHGAYVSCVAQASEDFVDLGLITEAEKGAIVSAAGKSACGKNEVSPTPIGGLGVGVRAAGLPPLFSAV